MFRILRVHDREYGCGDREDDNGTTDAGGHPEHEALLGRKRQLDDEGEQHDNGQHDDEPAVAACRRREHSDEYGARDGDHPDRDNAYET